MREILRLNDVSKEFGGLKAVHRVNVSINGGRTIGLVGPNGAGKTTLFNLISGFLPLTSGDIYYKGVRINGWSVHRRVKAGITRTFEKSRVFGGFSVGENIAAAADRARRRSTSDGRRTGRPPAVEGGLTDWVLEVTDLSDMVDRPARALSFSYRRRLELAISVATRPELLLLDEPFGGTGSGDLGDISGLIDLLRGRGVTILLVEHNMSAVAGLADRLIYMKRGRMRIPNE